MVCVVPICRTTNPIHPTKKCVPGDLCLIWFSVEINNNTKRIKWQYQMTDLVSFLYKMDKTKSSQIHLQFCVSKSSLPSDIKNQSSFSRVPQLFTHSYLGSLESSVMSYDRHLFILEA